MLYATQTLLDSCAVSCYKIGMLNMKTIATFFVGCMLVAPAFAAEDNMELTVGQSKSINFAGYPTTGYMWRVAEAPDAVQVEVNIYAAGSEPRMVGAPRQIVVTVTGVKPGQGVIKLVYARPWEKDKAPLETHHINVNVK